jgi:hypothetical protein
MIPQSGHGKPHYVAEGNWHLLGIESDSSEGAFTQFGWLRGLDLNQRPLGYERPEISVSIGQQGTSGNPEIPLGTARTAYWGPYGDLFGYCPTMCPTI